MVMTAKPSSGLRDQPPCGRAALARRGVLALVGLAILPLPVQAQDGGLVTRPSHFLFRETLDRFAAAVRSAGWTVFAEIDHAAAAQAVQLPLRPRTVVLFGNPRAGTPAMQAHSTLALDLPMRVLVWEDDQGRVFLTRSTGEDIAQRVFARHGVDVSPATQRATDEILTTLVQKAAD